MAARKSKRGAARAKSASKLPKGFTAISGSSDSWPNDNTKPGDSILATITEYDSIKVKRGRKLEDVELMRCEASDGRKVTLWKSAGLAPLFEYEEGTEFYAEFNGMGKAKKGQNAPRLYTLAVNEG